jgi:hypothetical protein
LSHGRYGTGLLPHHGHLLAVAGEIDRSHLRQSAQSESTAAANSQILSVSNPAATRTAVDASRLAPRRADFPFSAASSLAAENSGPGPRGSRHARAFDH